jgi:hypothetical protein
VDGGALPCRLADGIRARRPGLPEEGDETSPWDVTYFVDAANHYLTAYFENRRPSYLTIDG